MPGAWEDSPWDGDTVAKVGDKIFAFLGADSVGVKSARSRNEADEWLLRYPDDASVMAYIGRSGGNTLRLGGAIPDDELREAIETSYEIGVSGWPRSRRPRPDDRGDLLPRHATPTGRDRFEAGRPE
jgi:predicted DNA-binding protein (MmcQ/YjbR family)